MFLKYIPSLDSTFCRLTFAVNRFDMWEHKLCWLLEPNDNSQWGTDRQIIPEGARRLISAHLTRMRRVALSFTEGGEVRDRVRFRPSIMYTIHMTSTPFSISGTRV